MRTYYNSSMFTTIANADYQLLVALNVTNPPPRRWQLGVPKWMCQVCIINAVAMLTDGSTRRVPNMCEKCSEHTSRTAAPTPEPRTQW